MQPTLDKILEEGARVFYFYWDSGAPGAGADHESIYRLDDDYYAVFSFEDDPTGPFATLLEAIRQSELYHVGEATVEVWSSEMTSEELAQILECEESPGFPLKINDEKWVLNEEGRFVRQQ